MENSPLKILGKRKAHVEEAQRRAAAPALRDAETGFAGSELFEELLQREIERGLRHGSEMTLAVFEVVVAGFQPTPAEADPPSVAPFVAGVLRDVVRSTDIPGRLGECHFAVLLTAAQEHGAELFCERIRTRIGTDPYARDVAGGGIHARAWSGIARWGPAYEDAASYLTAAFRNMNETRAGYEQMHGWFKGEG